MLKYLEEILIRVSDSLKIVFFFKEALRNVCVMLNNWCVYITIFIEQKK